MHRISIDRFRTRAGDYDEAVRNAGDLDRFCSSSDWVLPAHDSLMPPREVLVYCDGDSWLAFARGRAERGFIYLEPLEASWGLACPLVSTEPELLAEFASATEWHVLLITGVLDGSPTRRALDRALTPRFNVRLGSETSRHIAELADGFDAYLGRRGRSLRRSIARARRRVALEGIEFETADGADPEDAYARICAVEETTWKGREGVGFVASGMGPFYRQMIGRLSARGGLRLRFARRGGRDLAYIVGGVFAGTYRGLQFGFHADCRELGLGNLSQAVQIEALCAEGVRRYDLGTTGSHYKRRWADREITSTAVIVVRE